VIQLTGLTKRYGDRVLLDQVTWQVSPGDRVGLCGPNGAGKTTLLRMLGGLEDADAGQIVKPAGLTVGYLPQDGLEYSGLTLFAEASQPFAPLLEARAEIDRIEHALADPALPDGEHESLLVRYHDLTERVKREEGHTIELRVTQVLEGLGFAKSDFDKASETFSGGWQMRIALAKLLLSRPTLLLLDEPTAGVSHQEVPALLELVRSVRAELGCAVLLIEHDMAVVMNEADRIYVLEAGRVIADGTPDAIARHPAVIEAYLGTSAPPKRRRRQVSAKGAR
jgi:ATP-binding cassette subfamily F protein 3